MSSLFVPEWCAFPEDGWSLEEIKSGVVVQRYEVKKECVFFGREADVVDICTAHGSCSRVHARIGFDPNGIPWLRDLSSAHGTKVNKESLPKKIVGKDTPTAVVKGVIVYPGDILQFGASTRFYCLHGPSDYSRDSLQKLKLEKQQAQQEAMAVMKQEQEGKEDGISWGIDMNDENEETNNTETGNWDIKKLDINSIPSNCKSLYQRVLDKTYKLQNIQQESYRIECKGELTEGQELQLQRNLQKQSSLETEIEELETELRSKLNNKNTTGTNKRKKSYNKEEDDDVDDFYDRTKKKQFDGQNQNTIETEESLTKQWKQLLLDEKQIQLELRKRQHHIQYLMMKETVAADDDKFFIQNELKLAQDGLAQTKTKWSSIEEEIQCTEKLLQVILPKIKLDRTHQQIITTKTNTTSNQTNTTLPNTMQPPPPRSSIKQSSLFDNDSKDSIDSMPPPSHLIIKPSSSSSIENKEPNNSMLPPPPQTKQIKQNSTITQNNISDGMAPPPPRKQRKKIIGPSNNLNPINQKQQNKQTLSFDNQNDEWKAPKDQDGSGRTKLNEKFAGRY